jgi:hypothetical protein
MLALAKPAAANARQSQVARAAADRRAAKDAAAAPSTTDAAVHRGGSDVREKYRTTPHAMNAGRNSAQRPRPALSQAATAASAEKRVDSANGTTRCTTTGLVQLS